MRGERPRGRPCWNGSSSGTYCGAVGDLRMCDTEEDRAEPNVPAAAMARDTLAWDTEFIAATTACPRTSAPCACRENLMEATPWLRSGVLALREGGKRSDFDALRRVPNLRTLSE